MNWNDGITEFGFDCKVRKLSPKTISNYTKQLWYFQRFVKAEFNIDSGYDIALVQRLLQHSSANVTQRYIGIEPRRIEQAIEGHARLI